MIMTEETPPYGAPNVRVPKIFEIFYKPVNEQDFAGVLAAVEEAKVAPYILERLQSEEVPQQVVKEANRRKVELRAKPGQALFGPNADGRYLIVDGSALAETLAAFEASYHMLKEVGKEQRFRSAISEPWKFGEIFTLAKQLNYPGPVTFAYLAELYGEIQVTESERAMLQRYEAFYEMLLERGLGEDEAAAVIIKGKKNGMPIPARLFVTRMDELDENAFVRALGLANMLVGRATYNVLPDVCGRVVQQLAIRPEAIANLHPPQAMDAYLVAGADLKACKRLVDALAEGDYRHEQSEALGMAVKEYSDLAKPDLEKTRARILEIVPGGR